MTGSIWLKAIHAAPVALLLAAPGGARAQDTVDGLQQQIHQRDAVITDLLRRVEELERRVGAGPDRPPLTVPPPPAADAGAAAAPGGPGSFPVDAAAVDRALERALVRSGALLLPPGSFELEPSLSYTRDEDDTPDLLVDGGGTILPAEQTVRSDSVTGALTLRAGLPLDSQLEVTVPYTWTEQDVITRVGFSGAAESSASDNGLDDISIGFTKALLRERGWRPDLFANVTWNADTGSDDGVRIGSGTDEIRGSLTAVKRTDPLVWVGGLSYGHAFSKDGVDPGDEIGVSLGTLLAVNPETSLRVFVQQTFEDEVEIDGQPIPGSDRAVGTLTLGASTLLSPRVLLDIAASVGVTEEAPDFRFGVSLPIRFDLPLGRTDLQAASVRAAPPPG